MNNQPTLQELSDKLTEVGIYAKMGAKSVFDLDEACAFTGMSKGHLYRLTSEKAIPHYKKGRKLYFRREELENWLLEDKVLTQAEIESKATTYIATKKYERLRKEC